MSRRLTGLVDLVFIAAAVAATVYVVVANAQTDDPAVNVGQLAVGVLLAFAGFVVLLALAVVARAVVPPLMQRWRRRCALRRRIRHRARRFGGRR